MCLFYLLACYSDGHVGYYQIPPMQYTVHRSSRPGPIHVILYQYIVYLLILPDTVFYPFILRIMAPSFQLASATHVIILHSISSPLNLLPLGKKVADLWRQHQSSAIIPLPKLRHYFRRPLRCILLYEMPRLGHDLQLELSLHLPDH